MLVSASQPLFDCWSELSDLRPQVSRLTTKRSGGATHLDTIIIQGSRSRHREKEARCTAVNETSTSTHFQGTTFEGQDRALALYCDQLPYPMPVKEEYE